MKNVALLLISLFISSTLFAQFENFDLSKYTLPDIKRRQLDIHLNETSSRDKAWAKDISKYKFNLDGNFSIDYSFYENTRGKIQNDWISFDLNPDLNWNNTDSTETDKNDRMYFGINLGTDRKIYINEDKLFFHFYPALMIDYSFSNNIENVINNGNNYRLKQMDREWYLYPEISVGLGSGRIESTGDLRHALYILEDINKIGKLSKIPDENEIYNIALLISQLKNKRYFDSRLKRTSDIISMDSLLQDIGLIKKEDALYFTSLYDMWLYGSELRKAGSSFQFDLKSKLEYQYRKEVQSDLYMNQNSLPDWINKTNYNNEVIGAYFSYDSYKPIGLKWERFLGIKGGTDYVFIDKKAFNDLFLFIYRFNLSSTLKYKWFLNTRTNAEFTWSTNYYHSKSKYEWEEMFYSTLSTQFFCTINYYFSPYLKMTFYPSVLYSLSKRHISENRFYITQQLTLTYSLF
ncbi:MAG: hypothetical protein JW833_17595 [Prolixibacteraceae bacterium]|nr:hypothetical protein [Prolixibacteraceae bacterium]